MEPVVEVADLLQPMLTVAEGQLCCGTLEIEVLRTFKAKPALTNIPFILGRVERNIHA